MPLFVLCKLILQTHMCSHPVGIDVWFLVRPFVYFHTSCVRTAKALARLRGCPGSSEPSLLAYVISTIISWAGSNLYIGTNSSRLIRVYTTVCYFYCSHYMSCLMTKPTKWLCAQQRLRSAWASALKCWKDSMKALRGVDFMKYTLTRSNCRKMAKLKSLSVHQKIFFSIKLLHVHLQYVCNISVVLKRSTGSSERSWFHKVCTINHYLLDAVIRKWPCKFVKE